MTWLITKKIVASNVYSLAEAKADGVSNPRAIYAGDQLVGFTEGILDGQRFLGHSGAIRGFGTSLVLLPEHNVGYFFSFNAECFETMACQIITEFRDQFLEQFLQEEPGLTNTLKTPSTKTHTPFPSLTTFVLTRISHWWLENTL